jgi:hypothetical protein
MLGAAMRDLFSGQVRDLRFRDRSWQGVGIDEYRAMAMAKTGALMSAALAIGAELAGGGPEAVAILAQVGQHLGLASQVMDDVPGALIERSGGRALAQREIDHARELLAVVAMPAVVRDQFAALCEGLVERAR